MTLFNPIKFSKVVAYMLQNTEYQPRAYVVWLMRVRNFNKVMYRRELKPTKAANAFRTFVAIGMTVQLGAAVTLAVLAGTHSSNTLGVAAFFIFLLTPITWALLACVPLLLGRVFISNPKQKKLIAASKNIFESTTATKIAVAGSYGKTSMKEMLGVILAEGKKVAITPANKNVASSHAIFASKLSGEEEVLIVEFGEGEPGDVARFSKTLQPNIAIVTGIAPAHLDKYSTLDEAAHDIFSVAGYVPKDAMYVNGDSKLAKPYIDNNYISYTSLGTKQLKVTNIIISLEGTSFEIHNGNDVYAIKTHIIGRHTVGPVVAAVAIAVRLGMTREQIIAGASKLYAYEHRMQPRRLASGAWIVDDTYNGNIEGLEAGLALLNELKAVRKIYITPGLVDQGTEVKTVHVRLGAMIAAANPDIAVLMKNSVTDYIVSGMQEAGFKGEVRIETDPLDFYTNIEQFVASGDVVLMQNDWPDNYA